MKLIFLVIELILIAASSIEFTETSSVQDDLKVSKMFHALNEINPLYVNYELNRINAMKTNQSK